MAKAFPASRFTGIDFSDEGLAVGRAEAQRLGLANATFVAGTSPRWMRSETYDVITVFDAIHDQAQPAKVLENIYRALRPGGVLLMVDIKASTRLEDNVGVPLATYLYTVSTMHCMSVSLGPRRRRPRYVLGPPAGDVDACRRRLRRSDGNAIETDPFNNYYIARK